MKAGRKTAVALLDRPAPAIKLHPQMPLVDDIAGVSDYVPTEHAIQRCQERGIGILEVYSALADPQVTRSNRNDPNLRTYMRGDLRVTVDLEGKRIVTVVDVDADERETPREPLHPFVEKGRSSVPRRTQTDNSDVLDDAWILLPHKQDDKRKVKITPALAARILELNRHNRQLRRADVEDFKRKIEAGEFRTTHQGIAIDSKMTLQDGQHRLTAIAEGTKAVMMWVAVGQDPANFDVIDVGRNRSYADVLFLAGESDPADLGAAVRLVQLYRNTDYGSWTKNKISNHLVMETFNSDKDGFRDAKQMGKWINKNIPITKTAGAAAFYIIMKANPRHEATVEDFFEGLATGADVPGGDPRHVLIRNVQRAARNRERAFAAEHLALIIKCWNAFVERRSVNVLSWKRAEPMPRVTKMEG